MTKEEFKQQTEGKKTCIKCSAEWCSPCKALGKTLEKVEPNYPNVNFIHIDVEESPELAQEFQIQNIPVMIFMDEDGNIVNRKVGLMPEKAIIAEIENLLKS
jgi:thioredoxin 1